MWRPRARGWIFLQSALVLELLKHLYILIGTLLVIRLSARITPENTSVILLEIILVAGLWGSLRYIRHNGAYFSSANETLNFSKIPIFVMVIFLAVVGTCLPRMEHYTRINAMQHGISNRMSLIIVNDWVFDAALSPDGKYIAAVRGNKHDITVWDVETRQSIMALKSNGYPIQISFSPDSKYLIFSRATSGDEEYTGMEVWNTQSWQREEPFKQNDHATKSPKIAISFSFSPNASYLAIPEFIGNRRYRCEIWNYHTGKIVRTLNEGAVFYAWLDNDNFVILQNGLLQVANMSADKISRALNIGANDQDGEFSSMCSSPENRHLAVYRVKRLSEEGRAKEIGIIQIWDIANEQLKVTLSLDHAGIDKAMVFTPDGKYLVTGDENSSEISFWDITTGKAVKKLEHPTSQVSKLMVTRDGKKLVSAGGSMIAIWNLD
jgi:FOG: WD40 repeat